MPRTAAPARPIRTQLTVPLRFADGYTTTARVFTFDGLVDGRRASRPRAGRPGGPLRDRAPPGSPPLVRPHSECLTGDVFGSQRCDCGAAAPRGGRAGSPTPAGSCSTCDRRVAASACTPSSTRTRCRTTGLDTYDANLALGYAADERDYTAAAQMLHALG